MDAAEVSARVAANLTAVRARVAAAATRSGRAPERVRLVAVSKTFGPEYVRAAHAAGHTDFGENKVQEAFAKQEATADLGLTWHLLGHLQSNKARKSAGAFEWIHSVDRLDVLRRLDQAAVEAAAQPRLLIQVDLAAEPTKFGLPVPDLRPLLDVAAGCRAARVAGLMVLPPWGEHPEAARSWFRQLRDLRDALVAEGYPDGMLQELSMGMSHDFEVAIEEGATQVRVGTAIFGARPPVASPTV